MCIRDRDSGAAGIDTSAGTGTGTVAFDATDVNTYSFQTNATIFDSQGNARNLTMYFIKDANSVNEWQIQGRVNGGPAGAGEYGPFDLGSLQFNQSGVLDTDNSAALTINTNEFAPAAQFESLNIDLAFDGSTQFADPSTVSDTAQNGYSAGSLVGITIEDDGTVMRNYSNEESRAAGQIALVSFRNPEGLQPDGENLWTATAASGQELVGAPGTGLRGLIQPSAVETSNVDMARELVDMIIAQRAYQANSQTISTQDELLQTIINL
jgi:flagellar hook protein FlgE